MTEQHMAELRNFKYVPQLDDEGYFTGMSIADESPIRPGTYELARGALDIQPPPRDVGENETVRWTGSTWLYEPDYRQAVIYSTQTGERIEKITKTEDGEEQVNIKRGQTLVQLNATMKNPQPDQR